MPAPLGSDHIIEDDEFLIDQYVKREKFKRLRLLLLACLLFTSFAATLYYFIPQRHKKFFSEYQQKVISSGKQGEEKKTDISNKETEEEINWDYVAGEVNEGYADYTNEKQTPFQEEDYAFYDEEAFVDESSVSGDEAFTSSEFSTSNNDVKAGKAISGSSETSSPNQRTPRLEKKANSSIATSNNNIKPIVRNSETFASYLAKSGKRIKSEEIIPGSSSSDSDDSNELSQNSNSDNLEYEENEDENISENEEVLESVTVKEEFSGTLRWVEDMPAFPGGKGEMYEFLNNNLQYPQAARDLNIEGIIIVEFLVDVAGNLSDFKLVRGLGYGCDEEAMRVVRMMPSWKPGMHHGHKVPVRYSLPIKFRLIN